MPQSNRACGRVAAIAATLVGGDGAGGPRVETGFFDGQIVEFLQPAVFSSKPDGGTFACFGLGPDLSKTSRSAPTPILYVDPQRLRDPDHCDGDATALRHDHVLSTAPGRAGYTGSWTLVLAVPGPAFDSADMPYTSVGAGPGRCCRRRAGPHGPGGAMIAPGHRRAR